jgi:hypothetical protein
VLEDRLVALGVFLYIKSASDNAIFEFMCKAAQENGVKQRVVRGVCAMLGSWRIVTAERECMIRASVGRQYSQSGVLSPLLWSLVVKGLLVWLSRKYLHTRLH